MAQHPAYQQGADIRTIGKQLQTYLFARSPQLARDRELYNLFHDVFIAPVYDKESGLPIIPAEHVAQIYGKQQQYAAHNFSATPYLDALCEIAKLFEMNVEILSPSYHRNPTKKKCRRVFALEATTVLSELIVNDWKDQERVFWPAKDATQQRRSMKRKAYEQALEREEKMLHRQQQAELRIVDTHQMIKRYLHSRPIYLYQQGLEAHEHEARKWARKNKVALAQLDLLRDMGRPYYYGVLDNARLYSATLQSMPTEMRRILWPSWSDLDMKYAYPSIVATIWELPALVALLKAGEDPYVHVIHQMGIDSELLQPEQFTQARDAVKHGIVSLINGLDPKDADRMIRNEIQPLRVLINFSRAAVVREIVEERARQVELIRKQRYGLSPYGPLDYNEGTTEINRFLTFQLQAYELDLIAPLFTYAQKRRDFHITLYQYDGISVQVTDATRQENTLHKLRVAFSTAHRHSLTLLQ